MQKTTQVIISSLIVAACSMLLCTARTHTQNPLILKPQKLEIKDSESGDLSGPQAKTGDAVAVHYTGSLTDGTKFDSSLDRGEPLKFTLGKHMVIPGFEKGVEGMHIGAKRTLKIPHEMGYGEHGAGGLIPPYSTLIFEIELVSINDDETEKTE